MKSSLLHIILIVIGSFSANHIFAQDGLVNIAMAQIFCLDGDRAGNFVRIENAIVEAKGKGAQIVTLPESCILGWENPSAHQRARPIPGEDSDRLCELARKYKVYLSIGLDEKEGDKLYDSCLLIDDDGKIILKHRKVNVLAELMTPPYSVGDGVSAVETKYGKIGILICADSAREELLEAMKGKGPDILIIPYGCGSPGRRMAGAWGETARCCEKRGEGSELFGDWDGFGWGDYKWSMERPSIWRTKCRCG